MLESGSEVEGTFFMYLISGEQMQHLHVTLDSMRDSHSWSKFES